MLRKFLKKHENINKMNVKLPRKITISILETQTKILLTKTVDTRQTYWKGVAFLRKKHIAYAKGVKEAFFTSEFDQKK